MGLQRTVVPVKGVAREQHTRLAIVDGDARLLMARDRDHIQRAPTQIVVDDLVGPVFETTKCLDGLRVRSHEGRERERLQLDVSASVVVVRVGVSNDERD